MHQACNGEGTKGDERKRGQMAMQWKYRKEAASSAKVIIQPLPQWKIYTDSQIGHDKILKAIHLLLRKKINNFILCHCTPLLHFLLCFASHKPHASSKETNARQIKINENTSLDREILVGHQRKLKRSIQTSTKQHPTHKMNVNWPIRPLRPPPTRKRKLTFVTFPADSGRKKERFTTLFPSANARCSSLATIRNTPIELPVSGLTSDTPRIPTTPDPHTKTTGSQPSYGGTRDVIFLRTQHTTDGSDDDSTGTTMMMIARWQQ